MKKHEKVILTTAIAGAGFGAAVAATRSITRMLVKLAMDRKEPRQVTRAREKMGGMPGTRELYEEMGRRAAALEESGCERVEIDSYDGVRLVAHWQPCEGARRVLVAMHGWRSSWSNDFGMIADFWRESGCSVLYVEQRGQNNSGGDYMTFGLRERYDCRDWAAWVDARVGGSLPIYLVGISMGAATVMMSADLDLPDTVHGIMADCGYTSPHAIWKHVVQNNMHLIYGLHAPMINNICKKRFDSTSRDCSTLDALRATDIPVLFVHGTEDKFVPIRMTYENYLACASEKRLVVVPGAAHGMSYCVDRETYERASREFWAAHDDDVRQPRAALTDGESAADADEGVGGEATEEVAAEAPAQPE